MSVTLSDTLSHLHVSHHVHLHVDHHVHLHVGHRNVVSALCEVSEKLHQCNECIEKVSASYPLTNLCYFLDKMI